MILTPKALSLVAGGEASLRAPPPVSIPNVSSTPKGSSAHYEEAKLLSILMGSSLSGCKTRKMARFPGVSSQSLLHAPTTNDYAFGVIEAVHDQGT